MIKTEIVSDTSFLDKALGIAMTNRGGRPSQPLTEQEFLQLTVPDEDRPTHPSDAFMNTEIGWQQFIAERLGYAECKNAIWYRPNGVMDWHTNSNSPGTRVYYTYPTGKACFRWYDGENYHEDWEEPNKWHRRTFMITKEPLLWHSIWSEDWRLSIGFKEGV